MTVAHPFDSPRLTLERAKHHVRDLSKVVGAFTDGQPRPWSYGLDTESQAPNRSTRSGFTRRRLRRRHASSSMR
jgi:hypothetical protein